MQAESMDVAWSAPQALGVKPTPKPTNSRYTPTDNTPLHSIVIIIIIIIIKFYYAPMDNKPLHPISSVCHPWGCK